jgi:uncharacterized protein (TIGR02466 family)
MDKVLSDAETFGIFPVPIYSTTLKQLDYDEVMRVVDATGGWKENEGKNFISSDKSILHHWHLKDLLEEATAHLDNFLHEVMRIDTKFQVTQSWVNTNPHGTRHMEHTHRNSIWNCVMFLCDHSTPMTFRDPNPWKDMYDFSHETIDSNWANSNLSHILPEFGKFVIFPHYLHHSVGVNNTNEDRVSLAFNTWFKEPFGSKEKLTLTGVVQ